MTEAKERRQWLEPDWRKLVGRDLEQHESGEIFRGPVKRVEIVEMVNAYGEKYPWLNIYLDWVAIRSEGSWKLVREPRDPDRGISITGVNLDSTSPFEDKEENVNLSLPYLGYVIIHPSGENLKKEDLTT